MSVLGRGRQHIVYFIYALLWSVAVYGFVSASASSSPNYQLIETSVGGTGLLNSASTNYQAQQSGAILGNGTSVGTSYQVEAGHQTTGAPTLAFAILTVNPSFGSFSPTATATATSQFEVEDYTSYGYVVQIYGTPPTDAYGNQITPLATNSGPQVGTDQFGINLVANTVPITFGANPNYGQFGYGTVANNYNTANSYRFVNGEEIAYSGKSSGQTIYTISYIVDVTNLMPGGQYNSSQSLVCTGTY